MTFMNGLYNGYFKITHRQLFGLFISFSSNRLIKLVPTKPAPPVIIILFFFIL